jgi:uncharacterized membrane protein
MDNTQADGAARRRNIDLLLKDRLDHRAVQDQLLFARYTGCDGKD